jgi:hypothetical protein
MLMKELKEMGEIKVVAHFVKNMRPCESQNMLPKEGFGPRNVPEKALKGRALSHRSE